MFILKNLRIGTKLIVLILVSLLGFIAFTGYTFYTINNIDADSPAYQDLQRDNELIADILPPPLYIVESYLVTLQIIQEAEEGRPIAELIENAQQLQVSYQTRHEYWLQVSANEDDLEIIQKLVTDSYEPANEYFSIFNNEYLPAIQANDIEMAHHILHDELEPIYEKHRLVIDQLVIEQRAELAKDQIATQALVDQQRLLLLGIAVITILLSLLLAIIISQSISRPILQLTNSAEQIASGNLQTLAVVNSQDEIGKLATSFNEMSSRLRDIVADFEAQVLYRTQSLDKRNAQLKAVADVGKSITSYRNLLELLQQTTYLIHERFGYYHIGIFLLDARKEYAVLSATNSEGGKRMLDRGHQLKIGETGIVGYAASTRTARIALDVGDDAVFFNNPDLPNTRSEMALPLVISGQLLGVLDVQSTEASAFTEDDVATLQILAEQIAVAIQNANLFSETEKALDNARIAYGQISREAWIKLLNTKSNVGFIATPPGITELDSSKVEPSLNQAMNTGDLILSDNGLTVSLPIKIRGQSIGAIRLKKSDISEAWSQDETNLAAALSDQLSSALESARLYQDSLQRAARESLVSDISARLSAVTQKELIIRETAQELSEAVSNAVVSFNVLNPSGYHERFAIQLDGNTTSETWTNPTPTVDKVIASGETFILSAPPVGTSALVAVPVKFRESLLGVIQIDAQESTRQWTENEIILIQSVADRAALALENARLLEDSQKRAAKEQAIGQITSKISTTTDIETILRTAVRELGSQIRGTQVTVELGNGKQ